jgi:hypothetical protein
VRSTAIVSLALSYLLALSVPASAENRYALELLLGGAANATTPLTIEQWDEPGIEIDAEYESKALESPLYYTLRFALFDARGAWELQFIHHKIYLVNATEEVERFEISHGFNIFTANRAFPAGPLDLRVGAGLVLGHPDSVVRGESAPRGGILDTGYELTGPVFLVGAGKRFPLSSRFTLVADAQVSAGWATVTVAAGRASTSNVALHLMLGIGYGW